MFTNFKNSFTSRLNDECVVKNSSFLEFLAILHCDLSLITIHISEWCHFSDIHIWQGSVATRLRRGGIFKHVFVANLLPSPPMKKVWKSVNIWWSYGQEFGVLFFIDSRCRNTHATFFFFYTVNNLHILCNQQNYDSLCCADDWYEFFNRHLQTSFVRPIVTKRV